MAVNKIIIIEIIEIKIIERKIGEDTHLYPPGEQIQEQKERSISVYCTKNILFLLKSKKALCKKMDSWRHIRMVL